jgi:hypothetical protein
MGLIKNIFGGIFSFLGGIFKIFKKSDYYLEADDTKSGVAPVAESNGASAKAPAAPVPVEATISAPSNNSKNAKADAPAAPVIAASAPVAPQPMQAAGVLFAAKLAPTSTGGRRRPGPSLGRYMDMAKDVKMN